MKDKKHFLFDSISCLGKAWDSDTFITMTYVYLRFQYSSIVIKNKHLVSGNNVWPFLWLVR